jgi:23S rRNA pseudouridine2605 synthase
VDCLADEALMRWLESGVESGGDFLAARRVRLLRVGEKNSWLEVVLDEGKNRQIRRLLGACEVEVLRLVRVAIGSLQLGSLAKGQVRRLSGAEVQTLRARRLTQREVAVR